MSKFVLNEPKGQHLFEIYTSLSYVRVASYTSHTLPCLNIKHIAVKVISKDQQPLKYPDIQLDLRFSNDLIDIEKQGIDIAFRIRNPAIDNWVIRELTLTHNLLCGHPSQAYHSITHPKQLEEQAKVTCVGLVPWKLKNQITNEEFQFQPNHQVRLQVDEIQMMKDAVESGIGISYMPDYIALPLIDSGKLQCILPDWQSEGQPFSMLYRDRKQIPYRVRLLIEYTLQHLSKVE